MPRRGSRKTAGAVNALRRAIVDEGCVLPDGLKVGVYPAEDRARFTVSEQGVTLLTQAMLDPVMHLAA